MTEAASKDQLDEVRERQKCRRHFESDPMLGKSEQDSDPYVRSYVKNVHKRCQQAISRQNFGTHFLNQRSTIWFISTDRWKQARSIKLF